MEFLVEQRKLLIAKCTRGQSNFLGLLLQSLQNLGMTMSLVHRGICRQAIEVTVAFDVIHPDSFRTLDHHVERMVVVSAVPALEFDKILGAQRLLYELRCHIFLSQDLPFISFPPASRFPPAALDPIASSTAPSAHRAHTWLA